MSLGEWQPTVVEVELLPKDGSFPVKVSSLAGTSPAAITQSSFQQPGA